MSTPGYPPDPSLPPPSEPDPNFKPSRFFVEGTPEYEEVQREIAEGRERQQEEGW